MSSVRNLPSKRIECHEVMLCCVCTWIAEHFVKKRGDEIGGAAVGLGAQLPQRVRFVQQLHDPLLLRQRRHGNRNLRNVFGSLFE